MDTKPLFLDLPHLNIVTSSLIHSRKLKSTLSMNLRRISGHMDDIKDLVKLLKSTLQTRDIHRGGGRFSTARSIPTRDYSDQKTSSSSFSTTRFNISHDYIFRVFILMIQQMFVIMANHFQFTEQLLVIFNKHNITTFAFYSVILILFL
jgi:hypothetical protein